MIEKGWENTLQSEGIAYLNMYNSRSKLDAGVYTSDGRYTKMLLTYLIILLIL